MAERQINSAEKSDEKAQEKKQERAANEAQYQEVRREKVTAQRALPWVTGGLIVVALIAILATSGLRRENHTLVNPGGTTATAGSGG